MNRSSRLPVRSHLSEAGSSTRESRLSKNENRKTRASSTSRASSRSSNPMALYTPLTRSKSSVSLKLTPQSIQSVRSRSAASADRRRLKKKDERPIHDKKWQADVLRATEDYFKNNPNGSTILHQNKRIRPLTINMFVQLVNIVLKNIDESIESLTTTNYVERVPVYLTKFMYPGNVTSSMLKTANTMHTWPHILAILSWLVELVNRMKICNAFIQENIFVLPDEIPQAELIDLQNQQLQSKTLMASFIKWNKGEDTEENYKDIFDNYSQGLKENYNFDENTAKQLKESRDKLKRQVNEDKKIVEQLEEQVIKAEEEEDKLIEKKKYLDEISAQQEEYITKQEARIAEYKKANKSLREEDEKYKSKIKELNKKIKNQPMKKQDKEIQLRVIEELRTELNLLRSERKHLQTVSDETDLKFSQMRQEMKAKASKFNMELFKPSLKHPELKDFAIEITENANVFSPEYFKNIDEKIKMAAKFHLELKQNIEQESENINSLKLQNEQKQEESVKLQKKYEATLLTNSERKEILENKLQMYQKHVEQKEYDIETIRRKIDDLKKKCPDIDESKQKLKEKEEELEVLKNRQKQNSLEMLRAFENLEKEVTENIVPGYKAIRMQLSKGAIKRLENMKPKKKE